MLLFLMYAFPSNARRTLSNTGLFQMKWSIVPLIDDREVGPDQRGSRNGSEADTGPGHSRPYIRDIAGRDIGDSRDMRDNC